MTAIAPNTTIYAINVPLVPFGEDTILFSTLDQQRQYFYDRKVTILTNYTYQREHRNSLKATDPDGLIDKCNYLMFVNESYENKRMYAWITNVNWINNETCEIEYEIDYVQTFLFDIYNRSASVNHLPTTWVERQHGYTDVLGDNIQPENVYLGEYEFNNSLTKKIDLGKGSVIFGVSNTTGQILDNIYSGIRLYCFDLDNVTHESQLRQFIQDHATPDDILFAYMIPTLIISDAYTISSEQSTGYPYISAKRVNSKTYQVYPNIQQVNLNGYVPKNKKLLTYPYNYLMVSDGNGNDLKLRYEFFQQPSTYGINIQLEYVASPSPLIKVYPFLYKRQASNVPAKTECLTITGFPLVSWAYDAFKQWLARSFTSNIIKAATTAVGAAVAYSIGIPAAGPILPITLAGKEGPMGRDLTAQNRYKTQAKQAGLIAGANTVGNMLSQGYQASIHGDISNGTYTNSGSDFATGSCAIWSAAVSVNAQCAETIDNYFTLYGYAQNKLMQPNPEARMYYTYIKTSNLNVMGAMPIEAKTQISDRFNNGIRFWRDFTHFLDYTVTNSPRG